MRLLIVVLAILSLGAIFRGRPTGPPPDAESPCHACPSGCARFRAFHPSSEGEIR